MSVLPEKNPSCFHLANPVFYIGFKGLLLKNRKHLIHTSSYIPQLSVEKKQTTNPNLNN